MASDWDCSLEDLPAPPAVRLGLRMISGLREATGHRIVVARQQHPFDSAEDLAHRAAVELAEMRILAGADALASLSGHRRQQVWDASALLRPPQLLREAPIEEDFLELEAAVEGEEVVHDYATIGLTLRSSSFTPLATHSCTIDVFAPPRIWPEPRAAAAFATPASSRFASSRTRPWARSLSASRTRPGSCR